MKLTTALLCFASAMLTAALPPVKEVTSTTAAIEARQLLMDGSTTNCCTNCPGAYDYDTYWKAFNDLCEWLGGAQTLWTTQAYNTHDYYCKDSWDPNVCLNLQIQYWCGANSESPVSDANPAGAVRIDYAGCMGYFEDTIQPADACGGPPYPGAQTISGNQCWTFTSISDSSSNAVSAVSAIEAVPVIDHHANGYECEPDARLCPVPTHANGTVLEGAVPNVEFGAAVAVGRKVGTAW